MKIRGISGGSCILTEVVVIEMDVERKTIDANLYILDDDLLTTSGYYQIEIVPES